jgi:hypothetical protein
LLMLVGDEVHGGSRDDVVTDRIRGGAGLACGL